MDNRCELCGMSLVVASDSWDTDPRQPRVIHYHPCECVTNRLEQLQFMVDNGLGPEDMAR